MEKEREGNISVWPPLECPALGTRSGLQPRDVPRPEIEPVIPWFEGLHSIYQATPARAELIVLIQVFLTQKIICISNVSHCFHIF